MVGFIFGHVGDDPAVFESVLAPAEPGALPRCLCTGILELPGTSRFGACVRVSPEWILTAHHVVDIPDLAARFQARFGALGPSGEGAVQYGLEARDFFCSDDGIQGPHGDRFELDYAFVRVHGPVQAGDPSIPNLPKANGGVPRPGTLVRVPMRGDDGLLRFAVNRPTAAYPTAGRVVAFDDCYLFHQRSTLEGASGAPIFDEAWVLMGIHTHGFFYKDPDPLRRDNNWGVRITQIVADARKRGFAFLAEIASLRDL
ncbi:MAG: serine protease [Usitatibacter sp.]